MFITPLACDLWFGCCFPESLFWDEDFHHFTAKFQNHLTESFKADIRTDLGDEPFTGDSSGDDEAVFVYIIDELQKAFTTRADTYMGLKVKLVSLLLSQEEPMEVVIFGWPLVDSSTIPLTLLPFDDKLESRLRRFFLPDVSGYSTPVFLNMEHCSDCGE
jgi:hypothetical protein